MDVSFNCWLGAGIKPTLTTILSTKRVQSSNCMPATSTQGLGQTNCNNSFFFAMCEPWLFQGEYLCLLEPLPEHMLQEHNGTDSCCGTKRVGDEGVSRKRRGSDGKGRCLPMGTDFAAGLGCQKGLAWAGPVWPLLLLGTLGVWL